MDTLDIMCRAQKLYVDNKEINAYIRGFQEALVEAISIETKNAIENKLKEEKQRDVLEENIKKLAKAMRDLWPSGLKQDKYPWKCSLKDAEERLRTIFMIKDIQEISVEDCLRACRRYLNQFKDTTYMQTMKYFIFKKETKKQDDKDKIYYKSTLLEYLSTDENNIPDGEESMEDITNMYYMGTDNLI